MNSGDSFINLLMQETFDMVESSGQNDSSIDLSHLRNHSVIDDLEKEQIIFWSFEYHKSIQSFRINLKNYVLDFPRNWSIFATLFDAIQSNYEMAISLSSINDHDSLFELFSKLQRADEFYFVVIESKILLVACCENLKQIVHILQKHGLELPIHYCKVA